MSALRIVSLLLALALCYLFLVRPPKASLGQPAKAEARSEYKRSMDQAHAATRQMQSRHAETDAPTR